MKRADTNTPETDLEEPAPIEGEEGLPKPSRKQYTKAYKRRVVMEAEGCVYRGDINKLLAREGLSWSHLTAWRRDMESGKLGPARKTPRRKPKYHTRETLPPGQRHTWGPRKYDYPQQLYAKAELYFQDCAAIGSPPTMTGCVLALGFSGRSSLDAYREYSAEFAEVVDWIKTNVAASYERELRTRYPSGSIFALKNVDGWSDKQEVDVRGLIASIPFERLTEEQLLRLANGEHPSLVLQQPLQLPAPRSVESTETPADTTP